MNKRLLAGILAAGMLLLPAGCSGKEPGSGGSGTSGGDAGSSISTPEIDPQGRDHDETFTVSEGEKYSCAFFDATVNSSKFTDTVGDTAAGDGYKFLVVNMTITNIFDSDDNLPMYDTDFDLKWGDMTDDEYIYCEDVLPDNQFPSQLPAEYELAKNETRTGDMVFKVPSDATADFLLRYYEFYQDDFVGNTYLVKLNPQAA